MWIFGGGVDGGLGVDTGKVVRDLASDGDQGDVTKTPIKKEIS
jgi:hypothetical protein